MREQAQNPGTWIGANVSLFANVVMGKGVIVEARTVVVDNVDEFAIGIGFAAKRIRSRG